MKKIGLIGRVDSLLYTIKELENITRIFGIGLPIRNPFRAYEYILVINVEDRDNLDITIDNIIDYLYNEHKTYLEVYFYETDYNWIPRNKIR